MPNFDDVTENAKICSDLVENPKNPVMENADSDLNHQVEIVSTKNALTSNTNNRHATSYSAVLNDARLHGLYNCDVILQCLGCCTLTDTRGTDILDIQFSVKEVLIISKFAE